MTRKPSLFERFTVAMNDTRELIYERDARMEPYLYLNGEGEDGQRIFQQLLEEVESDLGLPAALAELEQLHTEVKAVQQTAQQIMRQIKQNLGE